MALLCFENSIVLTICIMIFFDVLQCKELSNENNRGRLMFSFWMAIFNAVLAFSKVYFESQALQESGFEYIVENMQARHGWIPFIHLIKE